MEELSYGTTFNHTFIFILFYNKKQQGFSGRIQTAFLSR